ncbi:MAG: acetylglutamate kinase [Eubacteriales bacterium]
METITNNLRSQILIDALPYIQKYNNKIVVIKYGGNAMLNEELKTSVMSDITLLRLVGIKVVLVHGGGPEINSMLDKIGKEHKFINGLRHTDEETMDIVQMVLCGKINKNLVTLLQNAGGKAIGLSGMDGGIISAVKLEAEQDLGLVGKVVNVDPTAILMALDNGFIPVISTVGVDKDSNSYNINADTAAAKIAAALKAENFILMTDIKGLLRDKDDESTLIEQVKTSEIPKLMQDGVVVGGMIPKVECCVEAINNGVHTSCIIDGRTDHSILIEMLTNQGIGTLFCE